MILKKNHMTLPKLRTVFVWSSSSDEVLVNHITSRYVTVNHEPISCERNPCHSHVISSCRPLLQHSILIHFISAYK